MGQYFVVGVSYQYFILESYHQFNCQGMRILTRTINCLENAAPDCPTVCQVAC